MAGHQKDRDKPAASAASTDKERLPEALRAVPVRTLSGRLRSFMPLIERRMRDGVHLSQITEVLQSNGLPIQIGTLRKYLTRYHQSQRNSNAAAKTTGAPKPAFRKDESKGGNASATPTNETSKMPTRADLRRIRERAHLFDWDRFQRTGNGDPDKSE